MKWLAYLSLAVLSPLTFSQGLEILEYHPLSPASLGKGITKNYPLLEHNNCVKYASVKALDTSGAREVNYDYYLVKNTQELLNTLEVSGNIQAQLFFGKLGDFAGKLLSGSTDLGIGGKYSKIETINDSSLAIVIKASADYGRYEIQGGTASSSMAPASPGPLELYPQFQALLDAGKYEEFSMKCGTHFVVRELRKGMVAAIIKIEDLSSEQKRSIELSLGLGDQTTSTKGYGNPAPGAAGVLAPTATTATGADASSPAKISAGKISTSFIKNLSKRVNKISIKFHAIGGGGLSEIDELVSSSMAVNPPAPTSGTGAGTYAVIPGIGSLDGILKGFAKYLKSYAAPIGPSTEMTNKAVASTYQLAPMTLFGYKNDSLKVNSSLLEIIFFEYTNAEANARLVKDILNNSQAQSRQAQEELRYLSTEYDCVLTTLEYLANKVLEGDTSISLSNLPERISFDITKYKTTLTMKTKTFECYAQGDGKCGEKDGVFFKAPYWKSYFFLEGSIANSSKIVAINFYSGDKMTEERNEQKLFTVKKGTKTTDRVFAANGAFSVRFGDYNVKALTSYLKVLERMPLLYVGLEKADGTEEIVEIGVPELTGKHKASSENPMIKGGLSIATVGSN